MKIFKKRYIFTFMFFIGLFFSYKFINNKKIIINNHKIVDIVLNNTFKTKWSYSKISFNKSLRLLNDDYYELKEEPIINDKPIIYLYNTHPTEEYSSSTLGEYILKPTVIMNNYILEDIFNDNGFLTYVEEKSVKDVLEKNNMNYASSYIASRSFIEEAKSKYPSLKYFIDIHRDSLDKSRTTINIDNRDYAKVLFIVGLDNPNYQDNLEFTERINSKLDLLYPGLSKGIYKKSGALVNGVYNQDFSPYTILIEVGGYDNTTLEVLNTCIAFSKCFMEVINEESN